MPNPPQKETPAEMRQRAQVLRENARLLRAEAAKCFHVANQLEREAAQADRPTVHNTLADGVASALSFCREP